MFVKDYRRVPAKIEHETPGVTARWPIREVDGAPHFAMRIFDLEKGITTPYHSHWWEHEVFVLSGTGYVKSDDGENIELSEGSVIFIPGNEKHQMVNTGEDVFRFICLIPHMWLEGMAEQHDETATMEPIC